MFYYNRLLLKKILSFILDISNEEKEINKMENLYAGSESHETRIVGPSTTKLYEKLEDFQNKILAQGKKVVFVEANEAVTAGAIAVVYTGKIPELISQYKYRYVKINDKWTRNALLGYCDSCGKYTD